MAAQIITGSTVKKGDRPLCVGVDVGGTWIRVSASGGRRPATTTVTRADRDLRRLAPLLRAIWRRRGWRPDRVAALVVASRAIWTAPECRALARRLTGLAQRVRVVAVAFFFFKQKTAYEMSIGDWSSDVCSSDLTDRSATARAGRAATTG